jgi:hypothetical protein
MEGMTLQGEDWTSIGFVSGERREGILGKLGMKQRYDAEAYVCPECGLARLYADIDGE